VTTLIYEASIPIWKNFLDNLSMQLDKAVVYADAKNIEHSVILNARLYPNMLSLMQQVQMATDQAKNAASHLAGLEVRKFENMEINFSELQARILKTISFLETITLQQIEGSEKRDIRVCISSRTASCSQRVKRRCSPGVHLSFMAHDLQFELQ
jgi:hypothetical protein